MQVFQDSFVPLCLPSCSGWHQSQTCWPSPLDWKSRSQTGDHRWWSTATSCLCRGHWPPPWSSLHPL